MADPNPPSDPYAGTGGSNQIMIGGAPMSMDYVHSKRGKFVENNTDIVENNL